MATQTTLFIDIIVAPKSEATFNENDVLRGQILMLRYMPSVGGIFRSSLSGSQMNQPKKIAEGGVYRRPSFCYPFLLSKSIAEM